MAKTDQPGFIEKHVEKLVVGLAALCLVAVLAKWVISSPYAVEIGLTPEPIPPNKIDEKLENLAKDTKGSIDGRQPDKLVIPRWTQKLDETAKTPFEPGLTNYPILTSGTRSLRSAAGVVSEKVKTLPSVPPLRQVGVRAGVELVKMPFVEGDRSRGSASAKDVFAAHVTAVLDYGVMVEGWREQLEDRGLPIQPTFLRVVADRQHRLPDGTWSAAVEIDGVIPPQARPAKCRRSGPKCPRSKART